MQTMVPTAGGLQGELVAQEVPPGSPACADSLHLGPVDPINLGLNEASDRPLLVEPPEVSDELIAGAKAGPWIVERELGRGGVGAVYGVVHEEIGKRAALKVMHRRLVRRASVERILLEARVVNQVGNPNI